MANENENETDGLSFAQRMLKGKTTKFFLTLAALFLLSKIDFTAIPSNIGLTSGEKNQGTEQPYDNGQKEGDGLYVKLGQDVQKIEVGGETYRKNIEGLVQVGRKIYSIIPEQSFASEMNYHLARLPTSHLTSQNAARIATEAIDSGGVFSADGYKTLGDRCYELQKEMSGENGNR